MSRKTDSLYTEADHSHDSAQFVEDATNVQTGTEYLALLVRNAQGTAATDAVAAAYIKYRGVSNGIYYRKIKACADRLKDDPENMQLLRDMVR